MNRINVDVWPDWDVAVARAQEIRQLSAGADLDNLCWKTLQGALPQGYVEYHFPRGAYSTDLAAFSKLLFWGGWSFQRLNNGRVVAHVQLSGDWGRAEGETLQEAGTKALILAVLRLPDRYQPTH